MGVWYSFEVFDGSSSASVWAEAHGDVLMETALSTGATDWTWHRHSWGVAFEVEFPTVEAWETFCATAAAKRSLDAVPDPLTGLIVYRGRGGGSSSVLPRKPRPLTGSGSAALPLPWELLSDELTSVWSLVGPALPSPAVLSSRTR